MAETGRIRARTYRKPLQGKFSLVHQRVLCLDELPEFGIPCENRDTCARAGSAMPAAGRQGGHHQPGAGFADFPGQFPTGRGDEPLNVQFLTMED